jgi:hypothetical protein
VTQNLTNVIIFNVGEQVGEWVEVQLIFVNLPQLVIGPYFGRLMIGGL